MERGREKGWWCYWLTAGTVIKFSSLRYSESLFFLPVMHSAYTWAPWQFLSHLGSVHPQCNHSQSQSCLPLSLTISRHTTVSAYSKPLSVFSSPPSLCVFVCVGLLKSLLYYFLNSFIDALSESFHFVWMCMYGWVSWHPELTQLHLYRIKGWAEALLYTV